MKQIYAYIFLAALTTLSTTCMEKERTSNIQEKKSLLPTNELVKPDKELIKKNLYTTVIKTLDSRYDSFGSVCDPFDISKIFTHQSLINAITLMNQAKQHGITEHDMGLFTYQQSTTYNSKTLYFNYLKKYNDAEEKLPFTIHELDNEVCLDSKLAAIFNIQYEYQSIQDIQCKLKSYPAYTHLIDQLKATHGPSSHYQFCKCLYEGKGTLFDGYFTYKNITDFDGFYAKACNNLGSSHNKIYNFITLVERIKEIAKENDENYFVSKILKYQVPTTTVLGFEFKPTEIYSDPYSKNRMALAYKCVEQYNRKRGNKKNPAETQLKAFQSFKILGIPLPDNFDTTVFDETQYAFEEFQTLSGNIATIKYARREALEQAVKKILHEK